MTLKFAVKCILAVIFYLKEYYRFNVRSPKVGIRNIATTA